MPGAASTGPERTVCVREDRMRSGNAADDHSWTGSTEKEPHYMRIDKGVQVPKDLIGTAGKGPNDV